MLHTVVETAPFRRSAEAAGMSDEEIEAMIEFLAATPDAGDEISGTGGCRKLRVAGRGKGKSGGYRVITFFSGPSIPVFLISAYSKGRKADLNGSERAYLKKLGKILIDSCSRWRER